VSPGGRSKRRRLPRVEQLLPLACLGGAGLLILSEFMTTFRFDAAGETTLKLSEAGDRHAYAMLVLGVFAIAGVLIALRNGSKPAAVAVAIAGITALLLFLVIDLPDAGKVGTFDAPDTPFTQAEAKPEDGFWISLIGALTLAVCGAALATLTGSQLRALGGRFAKEAPPPRTAAGGRSEGESPAGVDPMSDGRDPRSERTLPTRRERTGKGT
jgi:hypothetical protein